MSDVNFRKFVPGIELVPQATSNVSAQGDLDVDSVSGKINYHNGTTSSPVVTEAHTATLTNKTIDAGSNTITNLTNTNLSGSAAITNANLNSMPTLTLKGNNTGGSSTPLDLTVSQVNTMLGTTGAAVTIGALDAQPANSNGQSLVSGVLTAQSATTSFPGLVNNTTQSFNGLKTFTSGLAGNLTGNVTGAAGVPLVLATQGNQNLQLTPNGTGIIQAESPLELVANLRLDQTVDSTTTGTAATLNAFTVSYVEVTNASLVSLSAIPAGASGQCLILTNNTTASFLINNQDAGVTAANRIITGTGNFITLSNNASLIFIYDNNVSRWRIVGGSGSGGSAVTFGTRGSPLSIVAGTGFSAAASNMSTTASDQIIFVQGSGGAVVITASPAIQAGTIVGQTMKIVGRSNTNTVEIPNQSGSVELNGNCVLGLSDCLSLVFDGTAWVEVSRS